MHHKIPLPPCLPELRIPHQVIRFPLAFERILLLPQMMLLLLLQELLLLLLQLLLLMLLQVGRDGSVVRDWHLPWPGDGLWGVRCTAWARLLRPGTSQE